MHYSEKYNPGTSTIIVEPVGASCNLHCEYCYHSNIRIHDNRLEIMEGKILEKLIRDAFLINEKRVKFLWHGGEPLLAGLNFYKRAIELQNCHRVRPEQRFHNHLQTNATLIDENWARFFQENNFRISTSIDGPSWLHNRCRHDTHKKGSFDKTIRGIKILEEFGLGVGVVITVNKYNAQYPKEVYKTLLDLGIKSFELNIASNVIGASSLAPQHSDAIKFLKRIFDIWFDTDDPSTYIRVFHNAIRSLMGFPPARL